MSEPMPDEEPKRWTAATVRPDMWVDEKEDPRYAGGEVTDERSNLIEYLRASRLTLEMKCAGLSPQQMAMKSVPPSDMSLLGLVRHLADVERSWFRSVLAGEETAPLFRTAESREDPWLLALPEEKVVEEAWQAWRSEVANAERFVAQAKDMGLVAKNSDPPKLQLREILVHMIEEYARHCGHADLIRERIDGRVGQ
ncbi:MAG TPA: DinB family protein [Candidatus Dormibacteraeota bacterium]|nr:DinB family protein [Candidatus Dormibacteraeota bacterium]